MSERDEATGQFTSDEALYGKAALEQSAGYVPMPEEPKTDTDELTVQEAADKLTQQSHTPESDVKTYVAGADLPDNMSMTIEQAAKALTDGHEADAKQAELEADEKLRAEVDELRGVKPEAEAAEKVADAKPAEPAKDGELDPEIEKALSNPTIKSAIENHIGSAETARQQYVAGLEAATTIAQAAFISQFPEFATIPEAQRGQALATMQQQDPERFGKIAAAVVNAAQLFEDQRAAHEWQEQRKAAEFSHYAKYEDAKFETMVKGESKENMRAIETHIPKMLSELGVDPAEFLRSGSESKFLRSAAAQAIMVKAAKYDMLTKAPKPVASKPLPPVQRPGVARSQSEAKSESARAVSERFQGNPSIKNAADMLIAQRRARG